MTGSEDSPVGRAPESSAGDDRRDGSAGAPTLSKGQRRYLAGVCHSLRPVVMLGQNGLTEPVYGELDRALRDHELIKVKLRGDRDERARWLGEIAGRLDCAVVQQVGMIACFYRPHPHGPKLELPSC